MITISNALLEELSVNYIESLSDIRFSQSNTHFSSANVKELMTFYLLSSFKDNDKYNFFHETDINYNEVYSYCKSIFQNPKELHSKSISILKQLVSSAKHPNIKSGEIFVGYLKQVLLDNDVFDVIVIAKSEIKKEFLIVNNELDIENYRGIDLNKLDKGCLIFNTDETQGYKVLILDNTNKGQEAVYWKDEFLKLKIRNDNYHQTNNVLGVYKNFVTKNIDTEFEVSKTEKIDLLNRSMKYFKEKESFDLDEFNNEVIGNEQGIASFLNYKKGFEDEFETPIPDSFDISSAAVKKQARVYKSVLKLDKNFHIYIHGDKKLIEKGFDEDKHMNYYKVYFKEEQ